VLSNLEDVEAVGSQKFVFIGVSGWPFIKVESKLEHLAIQKWLDHDTLFDKEREIFEEQV